MKHKLTYTFFLCLLLLVGCTASDGECRKEKVVVMGVSLYKTVFNTEKEAFVSSPTKEKMTIKGLNNDSKIAKLIRARNVCENIRRKVRIQRKRK